ncbi:MAG: hypothetical protein KC422_24185 [Trueperaceae bacterium]|nr:hypothetical protein [Trueperaceae bacterium]
MLGLRPQSSELYLERSRLLATLPEETGYVVWLEAPYGYGKSVLATQWAQRLEAEGWRIFWLSLQGRPLRAALAQVLGLPDDAPWGVLVDNLWQSKTLLVLEDLEGNEELSPLLKHCAGLLLLASRMPLVYSELLKLRLEGRLIHLDAKQLAFSLAETLKLIPDPVKAQKLWNRTQGWSLPIHFSALTGEEPEQEALLEGIQESLSENTWQEALFLAALPYLPAQGATEATKELAKAGFVQSLEQGYRLHPLAAEALQHSHEKEMQEAVKNNAPRLSPVFKGEAFKHSGQLAELANLLDTILVFTDIAENPHSFIDWMELMPKPLSQNQRYNFAIAQSLIGNVRESSSSLIELAVEIKDDRPVDALYCLGLAAYDVAALDTETALKASELGKSLVDKVDQQKSIPKAFLNGHDLFLNNAAWAYLKAGDLENAEAFYVRALDLMEATRADKVITLANLAYLRWIHYGDLEGYVKAVEAMIPYTEKVAIYNLPYLHLELGRFKALLGDRETALSHFAQTQSLATNPLERLSAEAEMAFMKGDSAAFPELYVQIKAWENPLVEDQILDLWIRTLVAQGKLEQALSLNKSYPGPRSLLSSSLAQSLSAQKDQIQMPPMPPLSDREHYLWWQATTYQVTLQAEALDSLLDATLSRERILPGLIPLTKLPKDRVDLCLAYPLKEVLASGWQEAIKHRLAEIPPLELFFFGRIEALVLGQKVELTDRHKEILTLLALGHSREEIGEAMWPNTDTKKVRNNLNVQLNFLRKVIEPWGESTYLFEEGLKTTRSDLWDLDQALAERDGPALLALYKTPFAPGLELQLIQDARESYKQDVIDSLFEFAMNQAEEDRVTYLERVLDLDSLYEEALQSLLQVLSRRGRRREVQRRYQKFARQLADELGLEPLPETQAIAQSSS